MDEDELLLTTTDNPFNPFTQFEAWYAFDVQQGYNTCSYLARIANSSPELSERLEDSITREAIEEIALFNLSGKHIKVTRNNFDSVIKKYQSQ